MAALMHHHSGIAVYAPEQMSRSEWNSVLRRHLSHGDEAECIEAGTPTQETDMHKGTGGQAAIEAEARECAADEERQANRRSTVRSQTGPARQNKLAPERW